MSERIGCTFVDVLQKEAIRRAYSDGSYRVMHIEVCVRGCGLC